MKPLSVAIAIIMIAGCKTRLFNSPKDASAKGDASGSVAPQTPAHLLYTFFASGTDPADYQAFDKSNFKRFAVRTSGAFVRAGGAWKSDLDDKASFSFLCASGSAVNTRCQYDVSFPTGTGNGVAFTCVGAEKELITFGQSAWIPCSNGTTLRIVAPRAASPVFARPATKQFEFLRIGNPYKASQARVPVIDARTPLKFRLPPKLTSHKVFMDSFPRAIAYWNAAAGKEILSLDFETSDTPLDTIRSAVFVAKTDPNAIAAARYFADGVTGEILSIHLVLNEILFAKADFGGLITDADFLGMLIHELGHGLALAHNFAASADPLAKSIGGPTSFMDYFETRADTDVKTPRPYDAAALRYLYLSEAPARAFLHCNDVQSAYVPECAPYEGSPRPVGTLLATLTALNDAALAQNLADASAAVGEDQLVGAAAGKTGAHLALLEAPHFGEGGKGTAFALAYKQIWFGKNDDTSATAALKDKWLEKIAGVRARAGSDPKLSTHSKLPRLLDWMETILKKPFLLAGSPEAADPTP